MNNAVKTVPQILRDNICTVFNTLNACTSPAGPIQSNNSSPYHGELLLCHFRSRSCFISSSGVVMGAMPKFSTR